MKTNSKNRKIFLFACTILTVVATLTFSFAWFFDSRNVGIENDSDITCSVGNNLDIRMKKDDGTWTEWAKKHKSIGGLPNLEDVSGNGLKLYSAQGFVEDKDTDQITPTAFGVANKMDELGFGDYIEIEIQIRSKSFIDIYFSEESLILPLDPKKLGNVFGDFSPDYIAGAMRVAVIEREDIDEKTYKDTLKMVWAPNPEYHLTYNPENKTYTFNENDVQTENYEYFSYYCVPGEENQYSMTVNKETTNKETAPVAEEKLANTLPVEPKLHRVSHEEFVTKKYVVGSTYSNNKMFHQSPLITTLDPNNPDQVNEERYAVSHIIFRVWFEGTDREANQALSGGKVKMNLNLVGNYKKPECAPEFKQNVDNIHLNQDTMKFEGFDHTTIDNIYFSSNGYSWEKLKYNEGSDTNIPNIEELLLKRQRDIYFYFKYDETLDSMEYIGAPIYIPYVPTEG